MKIIRFFTAALLVLAFWSAEPLQAHSSSESPTDRGGDFIKGGGGCREIFLRMSLNRLGGDARACLMDAICRASSENIVALEALLTVVRPQSEIEIKFDESLFDACLGLGGVAKAGFCLSVDRSDPTVYVSPGRLYAEESSLRPTMTAFLSELYLRRARVADHVWPQVAAAIQRRSEAAVVNLRDPASQIEITYHLDYLSSTMEVAMAQGGHTHYASQLVRAQGRDPCVMQGAGAMLKATFSGLGWGGEDRRTFAARAIFTCRDKSVYAGSVTFRIQPSGAPQVEYSGINRQAL